MRTIRFERKHSYQSHLTKPLDAASIVMTVARLAGRGIGSDGDADVA